MVQKEASSSELCSNDRQIPKVYILNTELDNSIQAIQLNFSCLRFDNLHNQQLGSLSEAGDVHRTSQCSC